MPPPVMVRWCTTVIFAGALAGFLPQGWAFFTRDPEASAVVPYRRGPSGAWERAGTLPQSSPKNLLGLTRNQRAQSTELALIANEVTEWTSCDGYLSACLGKAGDSTAAGMQSPEADPSFCGNLVRSRISGGTGPDSGGAGQGGAGRIIVKDTGRK